MEFDLTLTATHNIRVEAETVRDAMAKASEAAAKAEGEFKEWQTRVAQVVAAPRDPAQQGASNDCPDCFKAHEEWFAEFAESETHVRWIRDILGYLGVFGINCSPEITADVVSEIAKRAWGNTRILPFTFKKPYTCPHHPVFGIVERKV